jgi:hypothetical protein
MPSRISSLRHALGEHWLLTLGLLFFFVVFVLPVIGLQLLGGH